MSNRWHKDRFIPKNPEKYLGKQYPIFRSSWEKVFCEMCDQHPNVIGWASENISIKYRHPFTKQIKNYVPDFFVIYVDRSGKKYAEIIEIKPASQTYPKYARSKKDKEALVINMAKWEAARIYCKKNRIGFRILCEQHIFSKTKYSAGTLKNRPKTRRR